MSAKQNSQNGSPQFNPLSSPTGRGKGSNKFLQSNAFKLSLAGVFIIIALIIAWQFFSSGNEPRSTGATASTASTGRSRLHRLRLNLKCLPPRPLRPKKDKLALKPIPQMHNQPYKIHLHNLKRNNPQPNSSRQLMQGLMLPGSIRHPPEAIFPPRSSSCPKIFPNGIKKSFCAPGRKIIPNSSKR